MYKVCKVDFIVGNKVLVESEWHVYLVTDDLESAKLFARSLSIHSNSVLYVSIGDDFDTFDCAYARGAIV